MYLSGGAAKEDGNYYYCAAEGAEGREREMLALLCHCRCRLEAENEEDLRELVYDHLRREHPAAAFDDERVEEIVDTRSYRYELVAVYTGDGADEGFGPDPY